VKVARHAVGLSSVAMSSAPSPPPPDRAQDARRARWPRFAGAAPLLAVVQCGTSEPTADGTRFPPTAPVPAAAAASRLVLVDVDADPLGLGDHPGALFVFDPATSGLSLLHSSAALVDPVDVIATPDGALLVLDGRLEGGRGAIVRIEPDGRTHELPLPPALVDPTRFAHAPDGSLWIADRGVQLPDGGGPGALWRLEPDLRTITCLAAGAPLEVPTAICFDAEAAWLLDADAFRKELGDYAEGGLFRAAHDGTGFREAARLALVSPYSLAPLQDGRFLVADVNADPKVRTRFCGGLYAVARDGTHELYAWSRDFRDPTDACPDGAAIWVTDGSSDPLRLGDDGTGKGFAGHGRGALYRVDPATRAVALAHASPWFRNLTRVRRIAGGPVAQALPTEGGR